MDDTDGDISGQTWTERQAAIDDDWDAVRGQLMNDYLENSVYFNAICQTCKKKSGLNMLIRCFSCVKVLGNECDATFHGTQPFHNRWLTSMTIWKQLTACDFINNEGSIYKHGSLIVMSF